MQLDDLPLATLEAMREQLEIEVRREGVRLYRPYLKQQDFHREGMEFRERCFAAGNQVGKSLAAAAELAIHLTGEYPDWWEGRRWDRPTAAWASGVTGESTRDTIQRLLMGRPGQIGTGMIPADSLVSTTAARGISEAIDIVTVRHRNGGTSTLTFKSYEKGREKWQGETLDIVAFDEEPPQDIYTEGLTRTNATGGFVWLTFTPLLGMSDVVLRFFHERSPDRCLITATIDDAEHYTDDERNRIVASYPAHEREARARGVPTLGSGRVFPVPEERVVVTPFAIPNHWPQIGGIDFGWDHPTGAVRLAWDRDADVIYVIADYREREATPIIHAGALKPWGSWLPWAWPHDGLQHDKGSGDQLADQYRAHGLKLTRNRATFSDGSNGVEAGLQEMLERMLTGRWRVFSSCQSWLDEFRLYHRKDGKVVKVRDDVISASRYAFMMRRKASVALQYRPVEIIQGWQPCDPAFGY